MTYRILKDTDLNFPLCHILTASAGSGKTYELTHRYVQLLLSEKIPNNALRQILAITFTNNAAKEMKQRIVNVLKAVALGERDALGKILQRISLTEPEAIVRAQLVLEEILNNYSDFQVKTIDSFMTSVFKSSSVEYGYHPSINIELHPSNIVQNAFDEFSRSMREHSPEADLLVQLERLVSEHSSDSFLWDPYKDVVRKVESLYRSTIVSPSSLESRDRSADLRRHCEQVVEHASAIEKLIHSADIPENKSFMAALESYKSGSARHIVQSGIKSKAHNKVQDPAPLESLLNQMHAEHEKLNQSIRQVARVYAQNYYHPYIQAIHMVQGTMEKMKREQDELFLDDVHHLISSTMNGGAVPDIYFALGETIYHYLIDEFQDTNQAQWGNLAPLIENSLAQRGSLFVVGDTKQSIYTFRGADWQIMKNLSRENAFPSAQYESKELTTNYRSDGKILEFSKEVFQVKAAELGYSEEAKASGLSAFTQEVVEEKKKSGYVEVSILDKDSETIPEREKLLDSIRTCVRRGYEFGNIAVLTSGNNDVVAVSTWLNEQSIPFVSLSSLDVRRRKIIREFLALFRFLDSPIDNLSFVTFLTGDFFGSFLAINGIRLTPAELQKFLFEHRSTKIIYRAFRNDYPHIWDRYIEPIFSVVGFLPLYDLVSLVYKIFSVYTTVPHEEASLVKFIELTREFEAEGKNSLKEFVQTAEEENDDAAWQIDIPPDQNAVRIMTIHKAKGLDFRVVIFLYYDRKQQLRNELSVEDADGTNLLRIDEKICELVPELNDLRQSDSFRLRVDELNKLYVALTRAQEEMYVIAVRQENIAKPFSGLFPAERYPVRPVSSIVEKSKQKVIRAIPLSHNRGIGGLYKEQRPVRVHEVRRGEIIHAVLANIEYIGEDIEAQLTGLIRTKDDEHQRLCRRYDVTRILLAFLQNTSFRHYFIPQQGRIVYRELDLVSREGFLFRADRIVVDPASVTVLDFKTGDDSLEDEYREQVRRYMRIAADVFEHRSVCGYLAYVDMKTLRGVQ